jgi:uncharacterized membrane protein YphA (DoxX/SURF4 family)
MNIIRRLARPLLAAAIVDSGLSTLRGPAPRADQVRPLVAQLPGPLRLPADPERLLRLDGALMVGAGTLLALGRMPRLVALALVVGAVPATCGELVQGLPHDAEQRRTRRTELLTRLGLLGGALLATVDTAGRPGFSWCSRHAVAQGRREAKGTR